MSSFTVEAFKHESEEIAKAEGRNPRIIRKALLHFALLRGLAESGAFESVAFQGGACLAEIYGNPRLSEDLDFAAPRESLGELAETLGRVIASSVSGLVDADVNVKSPRKDKLSASHVPLARWTVSLNLTPDNPSLPLERLKIEVAGVPVHQKVLGVATYIPGIPAPIGASDAIVAAESIEELLADKIVSFAMTEHPRFRDAWDIAWLIRRGASPHAASSLALAKLDDYGYNPSPETLVQAGCRGRRILTTEGFKSLSDQLPVALAAETVLSDDWGCATERIVEEPFILTARALTRSKAPSPQPASSSQIRKLNTLKGAGLVTDEEVSKALADARTADELIETALDRPVAPEQSAGRSLTPYQKEEREHGGGASTVER